MHMPVHGDVACAALMTSMRMQPCARQRQSTCSCMVAIPIAHALHACAAHACMHTQKQACMHPYMHACTCSTTSCPAAHRAQPTDTLCRVVRRVGLHRLPQKAWQLCSSGLPFSMGNCKCTFWALAAVNEWLLWSARHATYAACAASTAPSPPTRARRRIVALVLAPREAVGHAREVAATVGAAGAAQRARRPGLVGREHTRRPALPLPLPPALLLQRTAAMDKRR
eukprot:357914-Chlamydomonas_euryale.AAC.3